MFILQSGDAHGIIVCGEASESEEEEFCITSSNKVYSKKITIIFDKTCEWVLKNTISNIFKFGSRPILHQDIGERMSSKVLS